MSHYKLSISAVLFFVISLLMSFIILATSPSQVLSNQSENVLTVSVASLSLKEFTPTYQAFGKIKSPNHLVLTSQVEGNISFINQSLTQGGVIKKGDVLYEIDNREYLTHYSQVVSELEIAKAQLALELGEQKVAENDYKQVEHSLSRDNLNLQKSLMLRKPQLATAKANVSIAQSKVDYAFLQLERCKVISKADYVVISQNSVLDSFVSKGDVIGELAELSSLQVSLAVPSDIVKQLNREKTVIIVHQDGTQQNAEITHISPTLYEKSQLQQIFLAVNNDNNHYILNEFISAQLALKSYKNTLEVPLSAIDNNTIWILDEKNNLLSVAINPVWKNETSAFIVNNLLNDKLLITNKLIGAKNGMTAKVVHGALK